MVSIAEKVVATKRENAHSFHIIDNIDNLSKLVAQSRAVLSSLMADDNVKSLRPEAIANILWLLADRLDEMEGIIPKFNMGVMQ